MPVKRVRHAGGVSWVHYEENDFGEWSVAIEPEEILIDTHHGRDRPHIHDPGDDRRIPVRNLGSRETLHRVMLHLVHHGGVNLEALIEELGTP